MVRVEASQYLLAPLASGIATWATVYIFIMNSHTDPMLKSSLAGLVVAAITVQVLVMNQSEPDM